MKPIKRRDLIRKLKTFGFTGPTRQGKHPYMERGEHSLTIPGEHRQDIEVWIQLEILKQAGISKRDWEQA